MTVNDLIVASLKLIGVVSKTTPPTDDETADALARLNDMVDAWAAQGTLIYRAVRSTFALTSGVPTYTLGTGGTWSIPRPDPPSLLYAGVIDTTVNPSQELPVPILSLQEFRGLTIKAQTATRALAIYDDFAFPLSTVSVWPIPTVSTLQIALYCLRPVDQFALLTDSIVVPPGYQEAMRYNLAVRLAPEFGRKLDPVVAAIATESLAIIQRANYREEIKPIDPALVGDGRRDLFNWITGESL